MKLKTAFAMSAVLLVTALVHGDYLQSQFVGPDVIHHHEYLSQGPWHVQVLEIDLGNPNISIETVKAEDRVAGYERTSQMTQRMDAESHRIVGAINGDFYAAGGIPIGAQVINGQLLKREYHRSTFGVGLDKDPFIDIVSFNASVAKDGAQVADINTVNATRETDYLVLFNPLFSSRTETNNWGTEIMCQWLETPLVNASRRAIVSHKDSSMLTGSGNNLIPENGFVLSGHGSSKAVMDSLIFVGDTLDIALNFSPISHPITQLIGGTPRLIRNGSISVEWEQESIGSSFASDRHPRTAVGFNADSSKLFLFTVDGRQVGYSVGMSLYELADYMQGWGVTEGVNLDGGGSTTMVVRGEVVNSPSDASGERSVANALMIVNTAPTGDLAIIDVNPASFYTLIGSAQQISLQGFDSTYNPLDVPGNLISWSCDPLIGSIDEEGLFMAGGETGIGYITGQVEGLVDTAWVRVTQVDSIALSPDPVILEIGQHQQMQAQAYDDQGNRLNLGNADLDWWVTQEIGMITDQGYFSADYYGSGMIRASYGAVADSVTASVGSSQAVTTDDFSHTDNWSLTGLVTNMDSCALSIDASNYVSPPTSGRLDYSFTTGGTSVLYLNCEIPISGSPDKVFLDIYGDGAGHWMRGEFRCASGDRFLVDFTASDPGIDWEGNWSTVQLDLEDASAHWGNPNASLNFPITWTKLYLAEPDDANKNTGRIFLDNFGFSYLTTGAKTEILQPHRFGLDGPYPNPFNNTTRFQFEIPRNESLDIMIFDLQGRLVHNDSLNVSQGSVSYIWTADRMATGIYFYRATLGTETLVGKCLLLK